MRALFAASIAVVLLGISTFTAYSGEPTPAPTATVTASGTSGTATPDETPSPETTPVLLSLRFTNNTFTWNAVPDANTYNLRGVVATLVGRAGDSYCDAQRRQDPFTINLDEDLAAGTTSFDLPAPPVTGGVLFMVGANVTLQALNDEEQLAQDVFRSVAQPTECVAPADASPDTRVEPPDTGSAGIR